MTSIRRSLIAFAAAAGCALMATPAHADGNVTCKSGPSDKWKPMADLRKKVWMEGWKLEKALVQGDCYEVYARNDAGQVLEAFFHPVTLKKLVVYRRGEEIFRAKGFDPAG
jgi:hypothetical protein